MKVYCISPRSPGDSQQVIVLCINSIRHFFFRFIKLKLAVNVSTSPDMIDPAK